MILLLYFYLSVAVRQVKRAQVSSPQEQLQDVVHPGKWLDILLDCHVPFFLRTNTTGDTQGSLAGSITPSASICASSATTRARQWIGTFLSLCLTGADCPISIVWAT